MTARTSRPPTAPGQVPTKPSGPVAEREHDAVTVAMIVAPGVYARNRMFDFFRSATAQRARKRAATVRGIIPQLSRAEHVTLTTTETGAWTLRYEIPSVSLTRVVELTRAELAALRIVAERAGVTALTPVANDKDIVNASLAKLMVEE